MISLEAILIQQPKPLSPPSQRGVFPSFLPHLQTAQKLRNR